MAIVPEFLLKKVYKKGSLKTCEEGVCFSLKNVIGPGLISGFNEITINGKTFYANAVKFIMQGVEYLGETVNENNPVKFRLGQEGILIMKGENCLKIGQNKIQISVMNPEAGEVKLNIEDNFSE